MYEWIWDKFCRLTLSCDEVPVCTNQTGSFVYSWCEWVYLAQNTSLGTWDRTEIHKTRPDGSYNQEDFNENAVIHGRNRWSLHLDIGWRWTMNKTTTWKGKDSGRDSRNRINWTGEYSLFSLLVTTSPQWHVGITWFANQVAPSIMILSHQPSSIPRQPS